MMITKTVETGIHSYRLTYSVTTQEEGFGLLVTESADGRATNEVHIPNLSRRWEPLEAACTAFAEQLVFPSHVEALLEDMGCER